MTAIVRHDDRLLVLTRSADDDWHPGRRGLPGGGVADGEALADAAERESAEETGIVVAGSILRRVCTVETYEDDDAHGPRMLRRTFFAVRVDDPQPVLSGEHDGYEWMSLDEAGEVFEDSLPKLVCLDGLRRLVAADNLPFAG